ncbi:hypothetical protein IZU89_15135 [Cellulophaga lytica]|uniref:hypothetical protein n=1 Tax=Cellulophaga lytica TaxID=979 RepID=UPI0032E3FAB2
MFDDYISNHRSLKRLVNQLVFDFDSLPDQLNINDFLNFTYLKLTFPYAIKFLNNNWSNVIPFNIESRLCELEEINPDDDDGKNFFNSLRYVSSSYTPNFSQYKITKSLTQEKEIDKLNKLTQDQNILLAKTLIVLFGKENKASEYTSIKFGNNLRKLLQQKIDVDEISNKQFENLFTSDNISTHLDEVLKKGQIQSILDRVKFFNTIEERAIKSVIIVMMYLFDNAEKYNVYYFTVLTIFNEFIIRTYTHNPNNNYLWTTIKDNYLNQGFTPTKKLLFLSFLSDNRLKMSYEDWETNGEELSVLALKYFKKLIISKKSTLWDVNDYSFYHSYNSAKQFVDSKVLNDLIIDFWQEENIELLCAQMIEPDVFSNNVFKTSDYVIEIFESKQIYKEFIFKIVANTDSLELKEYLDFLRIESFTNYRYNVIYSFVNFNLINERIKRTEKRDTRIAKELDNSVEIFISYIDSNIQNITSRDLNEGVCQVY